MRKIIFVKKLTFIYNLYQIKIIRTKLVKLSLTATVKNIKFSVKASYGNDLLSLHL